jgi:hypothetical protein
MATLYKVCDSGTLKTVSITMITGAEGSSTFYTDAAGCRVEEKKRRLTFTASEPSDEIYTIWYHYDYEFYQDGVLDYSGSNVYGSVVMPAGQTVVTRDVVSYKNRICTGDRTGDRTRPAYNEVI